MKCVWAERRNHWGEGGPSTAQCFPDVVLFCLSGPLCTLFSTAVTGQWTHTIARVCLQTELHSSLRLIPTAGLFPGHLHLTFPSPSTHILAWVPDLSLCTHLHLLTLQVWGLGCPYPWVSLSTPRLLIKDTRGNSEVFPWPSEVTSVSAIHNPHPQSPVPL